MKTTTQQIDAGKERTPDELWLDQNISGEELIELDPLEETEDQLKLASVATGDFMEWLPLYPPSERLQNLMTKISMERLRAKQGKEEFSDFLQRIRDST